jgi:hypothetical protein
MGALLAVFLVAAAPPPTAHAATFTVNLVTDESDLVVGDGICGVLGSGCTLRAAIEEANASSGADTIAFNIPGPGVHTIVPASDLPEITAPVTIDGTTQPGYSGAPVIELSGAGLIDGSTALEITGGASVVKGLVINHFGDSVWISGGGGNTIAGNYIGTDATGTLDPEADDLGIGVLIAGSSGNTVGGTSNSDRNLISGTSAGVSISGLAATGNTVAGNYIGTDVSGTAAIPNSQGILVDNAPGNTVGGILASAANVISGNQVHGVRLFGDGSDGNVVRGNLIGTDSTGLAALGNTNGVQVLGGDNNTIGGASSSSRNVISGNTGVQVGISGAASGPDPGDSNVVQGNYLGVGADGFAPIAGPVGVVVLGGWPNTGFLGPATNNLIGGTGPGQGNVVANMSQSGVDIRGPTALGNTVRGNSIQSNGLEGIHLQDGGNTELPPPNITSTSAVSGTTSCSDCTIDVYSDDADEGRVYHGSTTASGGSWSFPGTVGVPNVTATVTDADGNTSEFSAPVACADANSNNLCDGSESDYDGDGVSGTAETACGSDPLDPASIPERTDGAFAGISDDSDPQVDEPLPPGAAAFDCDGDGHTGAAEAGAPLCGNGVNDDGAPLSDDGIVDDGCPGGPTQAGQFSEAQFNIGTTDQDPCGTDGWPSDLVSGGTPDSTNRVNILDLTSFMAPVRRLDKSPGHPDFSARWDLVPGRGAFLEWIAIDDLTAVLAGPSGFPVILSGSRAFDGPPCPWPP